MTSSSFHQDSSTLINELTSFNEEVVNFVRICDRQLKNLTVIFQGSPDPDITKALSTVQTRLDQLITHAVGYRFFYRMVMMSRSWTVQEAEFEFARCLRLRILIRDISSQLFKETSDLIFVGSRQVQINPLNLIIPESL